MKKIIIGKKCCFENWYPYIQQLKNVYFEDLQNIQLNDCDHGYIIPLSYDDYNIPDIPNFIKICPNPHTFNILDDKILFSKFMIDNNLVRYIPKIYMICLNGKIDKYDKHVYPCIIKQSFGICGNNMKIVHNDKEYHNYVMTLKNYYVQYYVKNHYEYAGNFLVIHGKIVSSIHLRNKYKNDVFIRRGNLTHYEIVEEDDKPFEIIFEKLNYTGLACIDYKKKDNIVQIFEINPRSGGTIIMNGLFHMFLEKL